MGMGSMGRDGGRSYKLLKKINDYFLLYLCFFSVSCKATIPTHHRCFKQIKKSLIPAHAHAPAPARSSHCLHTQQQQ